MPKLNVGMILVNSSSFVGDADGLNVGFCAR